MQMELKFKSKIPNAHWKIVSNFCAVTYSGMDSVVPVRVAAYSFCDLVSVATFAVLVAAAAEKKSRKPQN